MFATLASRARLVQRSAQAGKRFASTVRHLSTNGGSRLFAAGGVCIAAAGGYVLFGNEFAQAKEKNAADMRYKHVIIGAGVAARSCLNTLNKLDTSEVPAGYNGKVLMIGNDPRMNSVGYADVDHDELERPSNDPQNNILLGHEAAKLDITAKTVELNDGTIVQFDKCFIATGGNYPKLRSVQAAAMDHVTTFRRTADLKPLIEQAKAGKIQHITVVGGGALGTELALHLKDSVPGLKVTQVYAEPGAMHRYLPEYMRAYVTALLRAKDIGQRNFSLVTDITKGKDGQLEVTIDSWEPAIMQCDHVVFAPTQIDANTELAADAGLEIDRENSGVIVNGELQAFSDIYVGGDAASFPNRWLGRRREQNYDHAVHSGEVAAKNMLGMRVLYDHIWQAVANMKPLGLKNVFVGDCDARYETFGFWEMSKTKKKGKSEDQFFFTSRYNKGVTFYFDNGVIVGVLLCNIEDKDDIERARQAIRDQVDYSDLKRIELESELRELLGFELQVPMVRTTMSKTASHKKEMRANAYKVKRTTTESVSRHTTDTIKDTKTNLYWSAH